MEKEYYQNKESKEIEKFLNDARKKLIEDGLSPDAILPAEVWFKKDKSSKRG